MCFDQPILCSVLSDHEGTISKRAMNCLSLNFQETPEQSSVKNPDWSLHLSTSRAYHLPCGHRPNQQTRHVSGCGHSPALLPAQHFLLDGHRSAQSISPPDRCLGRSHSTFSTEGHFVCPWYEPSVPNAFFPFLSSKLGPLHFLKVSYARK